MNNEISLRKALLDLAEQPLGQQVEALASVFPEKVLETASRWRAIGPLCFNDRGDGVVCLRVVDHDDRHVNGGRTWAMHPPSPDPECDQCDGDGWLVVEYDPLSPVEDFTTQIEDCQACGGSGILL